MSTTSRFLASTRGRILLRLLGKPGTVADLAAELEISGTAVRRHVTRLERDGHVEPFRVKPTGARPAAMFHVTPEGQALFPKAYEVVLRGLTEELKGEYGEDDALVVVENLGHRFAQELALPNDATVEQRADAAIERLRDLGAILEVQRYTDGTVRLDGSGCPLSGLVGSHPEYCRMLATMIEDLTFLPVRIKCRIEAESPSCRFLIGAPEG